MAPVPTTKATSTRRPPVANRIIDPATKSPATNGLTSRPAIQYEQTTKPKRAMETKSEPEIVTIVGSVVPIAVLVILIIVVGLTLFNRKKKQKSETEAQQSNNMYVEESNHRVPAKWSQEENIRAEVPGIDGEYESVGLSTIDRHSYVNVEGNKYETLDKQQIRTPEPKTYAKLRLT